MKRINSIRLIVKIIEKSILTFISNELLEQLFRSTDVFKADLRMHKFLDEI